MGPLRVGDIVYGFCGGWFGRDSYTDKRVEAIGADWVVARDISYNARVEIATGGGIVEALEGYRVKPDEEDFDNF